MGVIHAPESEFMKEKLKWEFDDYRYGDARGLRGPRVYQEFPKMLYRAGRNERTGKIEILKGEIAADANAEARLVGMGFAVGPDRAMAAAEAREREIATLAANRAYNDRTMSEAAQREIAAAEDATPEHLAEVPVTPIRRRGRPAAKATDFND